MVDPFSSTVMVKEALRLLLERLSAEESLAAESGLEWVASLWGVFDVAEKSRTAVPALKATSCSREPGVVGSSGNLSLLKTMSSREKLSSWVQRVHIF
jgi:hypothetical protein